jgi:hypothetical protein
LGDFVNMPDPDARPAPPDGIRPGHPYAMHFGLVGDDEQQLVRFARRWVDTFADLPGWHEPAPGPPNPLDEPVPKGDSGRPSFGYGYPR